MKAYNIKDIMNLILNDEDKIHPNLISASKDVSNNIIDYLNKGYKISTVTTIRKCEICNEAAGPISYFSDGYWVWPIWLIHYILVHQIELPEDFIKTIEENNYKVNYGFVEEIFEDENLNIKFI